MKLPKPFGFPKPLNNPAYAKFVLERVEEIEQLMINETVRREIITEKMVDIIRMLRPLPLNRLRIVWNKCMTNQRPELM